VRSFLSSTGLPSATTARQSPQVSLSPALMASWSAAFLNVSGAMPKFIRLAAWMRSNDLASTALTPRYIGHMAACSRLEPWP
jgi:hypothetical protein